MINKVTESKIILTILVILFFSLTIVSFSTTSKKDYLIVIDAGHGGRDGGAVGFDGTLEKDIDLEIALKLARLFRESGINVLMTRDTDIDLSSENSQNHKREDILKRVDIINFSECTLYLSIHANSYPSEKVSGAQVFYKNKSENSKRLSEIIQEKIKENLQNTSRTAKTIEGKYLIDNVTKDGCLIEVGFLSNKEELALLKNDIYQDKMARCIFLGTLEYLQNKQ